MEKDMKKISAGLESKDSKHSQNIKSHPEKDAILMRDEKELDTISFRGDRKLWLRFTYVAKTRGEKRVWNVLEKFIEKYFEE
jgi:hypothetical protein